MQITEKNSHGAPIVSAAIFSMLGGSSANASSILVSKIDQAIGIEQMLVLTGLLIAVAALAYPMMASERQEIEDLSRRINALGERDAIVTDGLKLERDKSDRRLNEIRLAYKQLSRAALYSIWGVSVWVLFEFSSEPDHASKESSAEIADQVTSYLNTLQNGGVNFTVDAFATFMDVGGCVGLAAFCLVSLAHNVNRLQRVT